MKSEFSTPTNLNDYKTVEVKRPGLSGQVVLGDDEILSQVFKLRYNVFSEQLKWTAPNEARADRDAYDDHSIFLCVLRDGRVLGTIRIIPSPHTFMIERDFSDLVSAEIIKSNESIEVSRLAVDLSLPREVRKKVSFMLYELIYLWALKNEIRYVYLVTTIKLIDSLKRRFPISVERLGNTKNTDEGAEYGAGVIDLDKINKILTCLLIVRHRLFQWI